MYVFTLLYICWSQCIGHVAVILKYVLVRCVMINSNQSGCVLWRPRETWLKRLSKTEYTGLEILRKDKNSIPEAKIKLYLIIPYIENFMELSTSRVSSMVQMRTIHLDFHVTDSGKCPIYNGADRPNEDKWRIQNRFKLRKRKMLYHLSLVFSENLNDKLDWCLRRLCAYKAHIFKYITYNYF